MSFCPNCGRDVSDDAAFCPACGATITPAAPGVTSTPPSQPLEAAPSPPPAQQPPGPPMGVQPPFAQPPAGAPPAHVPGVVPPPPVKQKVGSGWKIAIIVGVVAVLIIGAAVAFLALFVFKTVKAPVDATNNYIEAINNGNAQEAWNLLHPDSPIKEEFTLSSFELEIVDASIKLRTWDANEVEVNDDRANVTVDMTDSDGYDFKVEFDVRKDGSSWKIYDYSAI